MKSLLPAAMALLHAFASAQERLRLQCAELQVEAEASGAHDMYSPPTCAACQPPLARPVDGQRL